MLFGMDSLSLMGLCRDLWGSAFFDVIPASSPRLSAPAVLYAGDTNWSASERAGKRVWGV